MRWPRRMLPTMIRACSLLNEVSSEELEVLGLEVGEPVVGVGYYCR